MNKNVVVFSMAVAAIILVVFAFIIMAILYFYWGNINAVKDSLSTASGFFGGITTLGAAIVAAYLFNDWREEKDFDYKSNKIESLLFDLDTLIVKINQFSYPIIAFYDNHNRQVLLNNHIHYKYYP
ncbi:hypothetical protein ACH8I4_17985, partial [Acinetobacter sp. ABJ_C3_5]